MAHGGLFGRQLRIVGLGPLLGDVVEHADFIEDQLQLTDELGMSGVWQIDIKTCFVSKGYEEAMGEAIVEALGALVRAVLHLEQSGNFPDHSLHFGKTIVDLRVSDA